MIIKKKRINKITCYLKDFKDTDALLVYVDANIIESEKSKYIGQMAGTSEKRTFVPHPVGRNTEFNLNGKYISQRDKAKELRTIERQYHTTDWQGYDHYGICFEKRLCYPKLFVEPPLSQIEYDGKYFKTLGLSMNNPGEIKHTINVYLEIFGYCYLNEEELVGQESDISYKMISWEILPKGKYPWEVANKHLEKYFNSVNSKNIDIIRGRHAIVSSHTPDFMAIGDNDFFGYVVYGYTDENLYIFESDRVNNATYVFLDAWEEVSKLTKREIIKGNKCYKRLIHTPEWQSQINQLFINI